MTLRVPPSRARREFTEEEFTIPLNTAGNSPALSRTSGRAPKKPARNVVRLSLYRKIAAGFLAVAVLVLGFVLYLSYARATVTIVPKSETLTKEFDFTVEPEPKAEQSVPGYVLETVVDGEKTVPVAGAESKTVEGTACGTVTIINTQGRSQQLVVRTRLLSPEGILFRITESVTVPANGKIDVQACADQPGASGDIGPTTFTIPGLSPEIQKKTYAESSAAMTGGVKTTAVVSQAEVDKAIEEFTKELAAKGVENLKALVPVPEARGGSLTTHNLVKRETSATVGKEQASFTVSLSVHVIGVFYDPMALGQAAGAALRASVGPDRTVRAIDPATLAVTLEKADAVARQATVTVALSGVAIACDGQTLVDTGKIAGLSPGDAEQYLKTLPFVESVQIRLRPSWIRKIPTLKDHIEVEVQCPDAG